MIDYSAKTVRVDWGVPLSWALAYPGWEQSLRTWLRQVRTLGLTQIVVTPQRYEVELTALPPGVKWEDAA